MSGFSRVANDAGRVYGTPMTDTPSPTPRSLHRIANGRVLGGVCQGVAYRFDIDPLFVRVGFAILALAGGVGVVAYLVLWMVLPYDESVSSPEDATTATRRWTRGQLGRQLVSVVAAVVLVFAAISVVNRPGVSVGFGHGPGVFLVVILGILLVVSVSSPRPRALLVVVLRRVFLGSLALLVVGVLVIALFVQGSGASLVHGVGSRVWQPLSPSQIHASYALGVGSEEVDLSRSGMSSSLVVRASVGIGTLWVLVPSNAVVNLESRVGWGSTTLEDQTGTSPSSTISTWTPFPLHVSQSSPRLTLMVTVGVGHLRVTRTPPARGS